MYRGNGDGFARCAQGHTHWGRFGAAGLLAHHDGHVLLQHRAKLTIGGGTWGVFGGARDRGEEPVTAALREAAEESTLDVSRVTVHGLVHDDHGSWAYDTVVGTVPELADVRPASWETRDAAWAPVDEVEGYELFPAFANTWPRLRRCLRRPVLVVDAANVMGSRADGWWRDRAGAAARLRDQVARLDAVADMGPFDLAYPEKIVVVEGKARDIGPGADGGDAVRVVSAPHEGDDTIVDTVAAIAGPDVLCVVVTADRGLRRRVGAKGAEVTGPRWLLNQLEDRVAGS